MRNRTTLITGASKGIGRALSSILTDAGHQVIGIAREEDAVAYIQRASADFLNSSP
jgi:short-subunit dehydrogenase